MKYSIIEEMYNGERGNGESIKLSKRYFEKVGELSDVHKRLLETLNDEQKAGLTKLSNLELELEDEASIVYYKEGLKFGLLLLDRKSVV